METIDIGKRVFDIEIDSLKNIRNNIDSTFMIAVQSIFHCKGRVILTGMGKSGIIARKISSTMSSLRTSSFFVHPSEAKHGDLGMVQKEDLVIAIGKSGETEELNSILPYISKIGASIISITGNPGSTLAKLSDIVLNTYVEREACPNNLAPTSSTTAALVMGDALAVAVSELKGIRPEDFAQYHPGGQLGKRLLLKVKDLMHKQKKNPLAGPENTIKEIISLMTLNPLGGVNIVDSENKLLGVITDGDIRRSLMKYKDILDKPASEIMTKTPIFITEDEPAFKAMQIMENRKSQISILPVLNADRNVVGLIRLHDLVQAGL